MNTIENGFVNSVMSGKSSSKLEIAEKRHESLKNLVSRLNRHLETVLNCRIAQITIQAVFNSSYVPHIVSCKSMSITHAPNEFFDSREKMIFLSGTQPTLPPYNEKSLLLPMQWSEYASQSAASPPPSIPSGDLPAKQEKDVSWSRRSVEIEPLRKSVGHIQVAGFLRRESKTSELEQHTTQSFSMSEHEALLDGSELHESSAEEADFIGGISTRAHAVALSRSIGKQGKKTPVTKGVRARSRSPNTTSDGADLTGKGSKQDMDIPDYIEGKGPSRINYDNNEIQMMSSILASIGITANQVLKDELRQQRLKGQKTLMQGNLTTMHALSRAELDFIVEQSVGRVRPSNKQIELPLHESRSRDAIYSSKGKTFLACTENSAGKTLQGTLLQSLKNDLSEKKGRPLSAPPATR